MKTGGYIIDIQSDPLTSDCDQSWKITINDMVDETRIVFFESNLLRAMEQAQINILRKENVRETARIWRPRDEIQA